jgi:putative FmdB family regulatory protein
MPIYEYRCKSCEETFEQLMLSSRAKPACPHCGSNQAEKLLSTFAAHHGAPAGRACEAGPCPTASACQSGCCPYSQ